MFPIYMVMVLKGRNGVEFEDVGDCYRAIGSRNVTNPQVLDYVSADGRSNGVRYALGMDGIVGSTRIAWIDYPKELYTIEELTGGDEYTKILHQCNVCAAVDQISSRPVASRVPSTPTREIDLTPPGYSPQRVSAGSIAPIVSSVLPRYIPAGIKIVKSLSLRPTGDVLVSLGLSLLADLASGLTSDPNYRSALQSFSDTMVDSIDESTVERVREDALTIAEAALKDGEPFFTKKALTKSIFKTKDDFRREVADARNKSTQSSRPALPSSPMTFNPTSPGVAPIPRLFE